MSQCTHGDQKTVSRNLLNSSTMWVPGIELRLSGTAWQAPFLIEPSHRPTVFIFKAIRG